MFVIAHMLPEAITVSRIRQAIKKDSVVQDVIQLVRKGVSDGTSSWLLSVSSGLSSVAAGLLLRGKPIVLQGLIADALSIAHGPRPMATWEFRKPNSTSERDSGSPTWIPLQSPWSENACLARRSHLG